MALVRERLDALVETLSEQERREAQAAVALYREHHPDGRGLNLEQALKVKGPMIPPGGTWYVVKPRGNPTREPNWRISLHYIPPREEGYIH
jgi:hypothetical protein